MRKHLLGATAALLAITLLVGCKDAPSTAQPTPTPSAEPGADNVTAPPQVSLDTAQPSKDAAAGEAPGAAQAPSGEAAKTPEASEKAMPPASPSTSTKSKSKGGLPKAELPKLDEPAAKQQATAPILEPPKATGGATSAEKDADGSKPTVAPPTDLLAPPMAGASSSASSSVNSVAKAEALYKNNCMVCHAANLQGDVGPNLTKVGSRLSEERLIRVISNGSKSMPSFKTTLKADQIEALASWLSTQK